MSPIVGMTKFASLGYWLALGRIKSRMSARESEAVVRPDSCEGQSPTRSGPNVSEHCAPTRHRFPSSRRVHPVVLRGYDRCFEREAVDDRAKSDLAAILDFEPGIVNRCQLRFPTCRENKEH
jgi:hypothetical protein